MTKTKTKTIVITLVTTSIALSTIVDPGAGNEPVISTNVTAKTVTLGDITGNTVLNSVIIRTNGADRAHFDLNGKLGIGITTPEASLDVNGPSLVKNRSTSAYSSLLVKGPGFTNGLELDFFGGSGYNNATGSYGAGYGGGALVNYNNAPLVLGTNNLPRVFIHGGGNLGVGTLTPGLLGGTRAFTLASPQTGTNERSDLELQGRVTGSDNNFAGIQFYNAGNRMASISARREGADNTGGMYLSVNNGSGMVEGIKLYPSGSSDLYGNIGIIGSGMNGDTYQRTQIYSNSTYGFLIEAPKTGITGTRYDISMSWRGGPSGPGSNPPFMIKGSNGNVGINDGNPTQTLSLKANGANSTYLRIDKPDATREAGITFSKGGASEFYIYTDNDENSFKIHATSENELTPRLEMPLGNRNIYACQADGNFAIGKKSANAKLDVVGDAIVSGKLTVASITTKSWSIAPDYVFEKDYKLASLDEVDAFVRKNKHLPEVPSAKTIKENGLDLAEMNLLLLKKVEELTLHAIRQENRDRQRDEDVAELKRTIARMSARK